MKPSALAAAVRSGIRPGGRIGGAVLAVLMGAALVACATTAPPSPSSGPDGSPGTSPSPGPTSTPVIGDIEYPRGATDVVVRFEEGGGFVPVGFFATEAPIFTLYGDGTVIFRDGSAAPPAVGDGIIRAAPFQTASLSEDEVQALLHFAVADGGLGVARAQYSGPGADLPTATFTINAGRQSKTVSVMALGMEREPGPDTLVLQALARLGDRLRSFGPEVEGEITWTPDRWRGVLTRDAFNPARGWPWPDIDPGEFVQHPEPSASQFPVRTMTPAEVLALGLDEIEGGFSGLSLVGPDGELYTFALRPLFPDEAH